MKWKVLIVISLLTMKVIAQNVIDVHSHIITPDFLSNLKQDNRLLEEGFPLPAWNEDSLLTWMDRSWYSDISTDTCCYTAFVCSNCTCHKYSCCRIEKENEWTHNVLCSIATAKC